MKDLREVLDRLRLNERKPRSYPTINIPPSVVRAGERWASVWVEYVHLPAYMRFVSTNFSGATIRFCQMPSWSWSSCDLDKVNFVWSNMTDASLVDVSAKGANLAHAILKRAVLRNVSFEDSNLTGAILDNAIVSNCDFRNAVLGGFYANRTLFHNCPSIAYLRVEGDVGESDGSGVPQIWDLCAVMHDDGVWVQVDWDFKHYEDWEAEDVHPLVRAGIERVVAELKAQQQAE